MRVRWNRRDDLRGGGAILIDYQKCHVRNRQFTIIRSMPWKEDLKKIKRTILGSIRERTRDAGAPPKEQLESHPPSMWKKELSLLLYSSIQSEEIWVKTHKAHSE